MEDNRPALNVGLIVPFSNFLKKQYEKSVGAAVSGIKKKKFSWSYLYNLDEYTIHTEMMSINPSPTGEPFPVFYYQDYSSMFSFWNFN